MAVKSKDLDDEMEEGLNDSDEELEEFLGDLIN